MHIVLLGAGGHVAQRIANEALRRKHRVTAVVRDPTRVRSDEEDLEVVQGDATDPASIARVARGADAIVNAISPRPSPSGRPASSLSVAARAVIAGARQAGVKRLIIVGGAGSLEVAPGLQLLDAPGFPDAYRAEATAGRESFAIYRSEAGDLEWTYISPAAEIAPGERTGKYRAGGDQLLVDAHGRSFITFEDYAVAVIDELEQRKNVGRRMTVAY